jgi:hypothetical protein
VAIIEETPQGEREIPITDATATAVRGLWAAAVVATLLFASIGWLVRRWHSGNQ